MSNIKTGNVSGSVIIGGSVAGSTVKVGPEEIDKLFQDILRASEKIDSADDRGRIRRAVKGMRDGVGREHFMCHYRDFVACAADNASILTPFMAPISELFRV